MASNDCRADEFSARDMQALAKLMFAMTAVKIRESGTVVSIRDALLPNLLNADVRLRLQDAVSAELVTP